MHYIVVGLEVIGEILLGIFLLLVGVFVSGYAMTIGSDGNAARWDRLLGPKDDDSEE
jgi:hypothetical protein